ALAALRSRVGFEGHLERGRLKDLDLVGQALRETRLSVTQAYLLPSAPDTLDLQVTAAPIEAVVLARLRTVASGSTLHLALVEVVRRQYKLACQAADRADKQRI